MRHVYPSLGSAVVLVLALGLGLGCGDSAGTGGTGSGGTGTTTATATTGKGATTTNASGATSTTGATTSASTGTGGLVCSGATPVALTVKNYFGWCKVTVGTNPESTTDQTVCVAAGAVNVSATANNAPPPAAPSFELGLTPWHHVVGDTGPGVQGTVSGNPPSSAAVVTAAAPTTCAWVCCQDVGVMDCPTNDLCP